MPEPTLSSPFIWRSCGARISSDTDALRRPVSLLVAALTLACAAVAAAGDDHGRARAAYEAGEIVSLQAILDRVRAVFTGSPVDIGLDDNDDREAAGPTWGRKRGDELPTPLTAGSGSVCQQTDTLRV